MLESQQNVRFALDQLFPENAGRHDYYYIRSMPEEKLRAQFRQRVKLCHPDKCQQLQRDQQELTDELQRLLRSFELVQDFRQQIMPKMQDLPEGIKKSTSWRNKKANANHKIRDRMGTVARFFKDLATRQKTKSDKHYFWQHTSLNPASPLRQYGLGTQGGITKAKNVVLPPKRIRLGQFLYNNHFIEWHQLLAALQWQLANRPRVGLLAIKWGFLEQKAVVRIIRQRRINEFFGQAGIRLGLINQRMLATLLGHQKRLGFPIGRYFVERGLLTASQLQESLQKLHQHNRRFPLS